MSTHSFTLSPPDEPGVGLADLIPGEGSGGGVPVVGIMGNIWACLEIEDECVFRVMMEELRRIVLRIFLGVALVVSLRRGNGMRWSLGQRMASYIYRG